MSKFEKKFGRYAIKNISLALILCYGAGYAIYLIHPAFLNYLSLDSYQILRHGQIWRLVTWIIQPPGEVSFFTLLMLYFYYSIGTNLERTWGTYRYNVYLFSGMLYTVLGAFVLMAYISLVYPQAADNAQLFAQYARLFSTYYVNMSIFLAFAATFPDLQIMLFFMIPIKIKIMGIIYAILLALQFIGGDISMKAVIGASLLNFVIFFLTSRGRVHMSPKQIRRRQVFRQEVKKYAGITRHKCAVCGVTEEENPEREFRFCSKCNGNYEYCDQHLYTHTHIKSGDGKESFLSEAEE